MPTGVAGLDLVPADRHLAGAEIELVTLPERERRLQRALRGIRGDYDYVFIDTPPSLGLLTLNALVAADAVLIPLPAEYPRSKGWPTLMATLGARAGTPQSATANRRRPAHHARRAHQPGPTGHPGRPGLLRSRGLLDGRPAERPPGRGPEPRHASGLVSNVKSKGAEAYLALAKELLARERATPRCWYGM